MTSSHTNPNKAAQAAQQDDIIQRLRDNADLDEAEHGNARVVQLEREAAEEIQRLRFEVARLRAPVAKPSDETLRLASVIADKIEDGTLFQGGIFSRRELADKVRAVVRFAQQGAPVADETAPDLRPHLGWALSFIGIRMDPGFKYDAALEALEAANSAPQAQDGPDLQPHLEWALRRIENRLGIIMGLSERYDAALTALNAATAASEARDANDEPLTALQAWAERMNKKALTGHHILRSEKLLKRMRPYLRRRVEDSYPSVDPLADTMPMLTAGYPCIVPASRPQRGDAELLDFLIAGQCAIESMALGSGTRYRLWWPAGPKRQTRWFTDPRDAIRAAKRSAADDPAI